MSVVVNHFGNTPDGREILLYTISNENGIQVSVTNIGAAIVRIIVPDKNGVPGDVVLGYDNGEAYMGNASFFGVVIGPNANRTANASFTLDGVTYQLDVNDGVNNLHSHKEKGWHKRLWEAVSGEESVTFSLEDEDGNLGFPGNKSVSITYSLEGDNGLKLHYHGDSDKKTILNFTNHTYFNLEGQGSGSIEDHELWIGASMYTPADAGSIPTGELAAVKDTPMDFTKSKKIGKEIGADFEQLKFAGGYDHNWVLDQWDGSLHRIAVVKASGSGRCMEVYTTLPGVQFYAGNFITKHTGKGGAEYGPRAGMCLETQYFPDSANKPDFPSCVFGEGRAYDSVTIYKFI